MALNSTSSATLHGLPTCIERPVEPLFLGVPDKYMVSILPVIAYWSLSLFYHLLDETGWLSRYKIHTPEEFLKRNRVTVREVIREVLIQHFLQTFVAVGAAWTEEDATTGCEGQAVLLWASWIHNSIQRSLPALSIVGIDGSQLPNYITKNLGAPAGMMESAPSKAALLTANLAYWVLVPGLRFCIAAFFVDTWQYFLHRAMHMNRWLYLTFHIRHHRLFVPYAFGALYNHPLEGFVLDSMGSALAFKLTGMNVRQGMWFFTLATLKTVDDHGGYRFPWNPLHWLTDNDAYYHDIHHQSWGLKANFAQPFSSFWDRMLGTVWKEPEAQTAVRYERGKKNAMQTPAQKSK